MSAYRTPSPPPPCRRHRYVAIRRNATPTVTLVVHQCERCGHEPGWLTQELMAAMHKGALIGDLVSELALDIVIELAVLVAMYEHARRKDKE